MRVGFDFDFGARSKRDKSTNRGHSKKKVRGDPTNGWANACRRRLRRRVRGGKSRPAPCQVETYLLTFVLVSQPAFDNRHIRSCLASRRSVAGREPMAKGKSPRNPMSWKAQVEFRGRWQIYHRVAIITFSPLSVLLFLFALLLPPPLPVSLLL